MPSSNFSFVTSDSSIIHSRTSITSGLIVKVYRLSMRSICLIGVSKQIFLFSSFSPEMTTFSKFTKLSELGISSSYIEKYSGDLDKTWSDFLTILQIFFKVDNYKITLWDTAGQERFKCLPKKYYQNADGVLLLFDVVGFDWVFAGAT